jgi:hypothetical protein
MAPRLVAQVAEPSPEECAVPGTVATAQLLKLEQTQAREAQETASGWTQLACTRAADPITVTIQVLNAGDALDGEMNVVLEPYGVGRTFVEPLVTIAAPVRLDVGYSLFQRELDLSRMQPGTYVVRVRLGSTLEREAVVGVR